MLAGVSDPRPTGCMRPRMATNVAQHKIVNLLKIFFYPSVFVSVCVFNVWPKTTPLFPVWPRDAKRLDTAAQSSASLGHLHALPSPVTPAATAVAEKGLRCGAAEQCEHKLYKCLITMLYT